MADWSFDMRTIEGCIGWGLFRSPPERQRLEAELRHLRAVAAAARAVSDGVDSAETAEANLLRALDAAIDRLDAARSNDDKPC